MFHFFISFTFEFWIFNNGFCLFPFDSFLCKQTDLKYSYKFPNKQTAIQQQCPSLKFIATFCLQMCNERETFCLHCHQSLCGSSCANKQQHRTGS